MRTTSWRAIADDLAEALAERQRRIDLALSLLGHRTLDASTAAALELVLRGMPLDTLAEMEG